MWYNARNVLPQVRFLTLCINAAPDDYVPVTLSGSFPVNFGTDQFSTSITVFIRDDTVFEPTESFYVRLGSTGLANVSIGKDMAEITILNDDGTYYYSLIHQKISELLFSLIVASGVVSIAASLYEVQESDGFVDVLVTKTGNLQDAIQGTLTTLVGSAQGKEGRCTI